MIAIGSDQGGFELEKKIIAWLEEKGIPYVKFGCENGESLDYPNVAREVCERIQNGAVDRAILVCGTGIGISMAANKLRGIRAAVCTDTFMAKYTRLHNDANVLCLGGRVLGPGSALEIVDTFLNTGFEGGRHQRRIDLIADIEDSQRK